MGGTLGEPCGNPGGTMSPAEAKDNQHEGHCTPWNSRQAPSDSCREPYKTTLLLYGSAWSPEMAGRRPWGKLGATLGQPWVNRGGTWGGSGGTLGDP